MIVGHTKINFIRSKFGIPKQMLTAVLHILIHLQNNINAVLIRDHVFPVEM